MSQLTLLSSLKQEPDWALKQRLTAEQEIDTLDLPIIDRVKYHRWPLLSDKLVSDEASDELGFGMLHQVNNSKPQIIQYGQQTIFEYIPVEWTQQGVLVLDLFEAMQSHKELVEKYLGQAVKFNEDKLTAYNRAYMNSGLFIYIPKNVCLKEALQVTYIQDSSIEEAFVKRILIVAESNSSLTYVEKLQTFGTKANSANIVEEVIALNGAQVKFGALDRLKENTTAYINRRGLLKQDATIDWAIGTLNDGNVIADFDSDLVGQGSKSHIKVVAISTNKQIQGIDTRVTNVARHSVGHILQHGVIMDKATLTFNGIGHILNGAKGADAQQESRVLMLSDQARGDANPILLIDESDVTAGHAASVGQVDEEQLFYLTSRGIPREQAEKLVIRGFLGSVISEITVDDVRRELIQVIDNKLGE